METNNKKIFCFKCKVKKGYDVEHNEQPPLNFFKFDNRDICSTCYAWDLKQEEQLREELYNKQHNETLKLFGKLKKF